MLVAALLIATFIGTIAGLITLGLRQRLALDLPPQAWPEALELPETTRRLRVIRWILLPFLLGAALLGQGVPGLRWLVIPVGATYVGLLFGAIVIDVRFAIRARNVRKQMDAARSEQPPQEPRQAFNSVIREPPAAQFHRHRTIG